MTLVPEGMHVTIEFLLINALRQSLTHRPTQTHIRTHTQEHTLYAHKHKWWRPEQRWLSGS